MASLPKRDSSISNEIVPREDSKNEEKAMSTEVIDDSDQITHGYYEERGSVQQRLRERHIQ